MKKALRWLDKNFELSICIVLMSLMTIIIFVQVIMRYVFSNSLTWSEELARYIFIWLIYIGISYGCQIIKHIKIDAGLKLFPKKVRPYIVILGDIIFLAFAVFITITGFQMVMVQIKLGKVSPAMQLPLAYVNAAPMVGFGLVVFRQIQTLVFRFKQLRAEKYEQDSEEEL